MRFFRGAALRVLSVKGSTSFLSKSLRSKMPKPIRVLSHTVDETKKEQSKKPVNNSFGEPLTEIAKIAGKVLDAGYDSHRVRVKLSVNSAREIGSELEKLYKRAKRITLALQGKIVLAKHLKKLPVLTESEINKFIAISEARHHEIKSAPEFLQEDFRIAFNKHYELLTSAANAYDPKLPEKEQWEKLKELFRYYITFLQYVDCFKEGLRVYAYNAEQAFIMHKEYKIEFFEKQWHCVRQVKKKLEAVGAMSPEEVVFEMPKLMRQRNYVDDALQESSPKPRI